MTTGAQTCNVSGRLSPLTIVENGTQSQQIESVYLQDEWKVLTPLTINYGLRFDRYSAYSSGSQTQSARQRRVAIRYRTRQCTAAIRATSRRRRSSWSARHVHAIRRHHAPCRPARVPRTRAPIAERANYYDLGVQQKLLDKHLTLGVDSFYEQAQHLIDEGQFGAPIILTPFNYRYGLIGGVEFTANYSIENFSTYFNSSWQAAHGKDVESAQFNFAQADLNYIASNYIHLDHEGRVSASGGVSYLWLGTRFSVDALFGTGLRDDLTLPNGNDIPNGDHTPSYTQVNLGLSHAFEIGRAPVL